MDDLKRLAVFAEVVRAGSLSGAARHLGISTSAVSQQLRTLERTYKVTLLHRSTRKLSLTGAGLRFAEHCQAVVDAAGRARQELLLAHDAPEGELRVAAPVGFARHIAPALAPLLTTHPFLKLRLLVDDALIDLIDDRIDLALRAGRLPDSTWVGQRLCQFDWLICASPAYLAKAGVPTQPRDLLKLQWATSARDREPLIIELEGPGGREVLRIEPRITSNNQFSLQQLCVAGLGLARSVRPDIDDDLRAGRLVPVLPDWRLEPIPIWAVTPQRDQPAKVRHAIEALRTYLRSIPGASE